MYRSSAGFLGMGIFFIGTASAAPIQSTVQDIYHGGDDPKDYGDVISATNDDRFNIDKMVVEQNGSAFTFQIYTNLVGNTDAFNGVSESNLTGGTGVGYGDLFLTGSAWDPYGSAPYGTDNALNGTGWTHALMLDNQHGDIGDSGSLGLVELTGASNADNAILSQDLMTGGYYRQNQEVLVADNSYNVLAAGEWEVFNDYLQMTIDFNGTSLMDTNSLAFHWTMYCGNDVIEGEIEVASVPEPGLLTLLGGGFAGLWFARRKRQAAIVA